MGAEETEARESSSLLDDVRRLAQRASTLGSHRPALREALLDLLAKGRFGIALQWDVAFEIVKEGWDEGEARWFASAPGLILARRHSHNAHPRLTARRRSRTMR